MTASHRHHRRRLVVMSLATVNLSNRHHPAVMSSVTASLSANLIPVNPYLLNQLVDLLVKLVTLRGAVCQFIVMPVAIVNQRAGVVHQIAALYSL
ncbi:MAG: hypothetical protein D6706_09350 [Chloroflexi bacterium]|nr:MAG: hypothetical protein D6706_09350 [Chloroflexota bacterium]